MNAAARSLSLLIILLLPGCGGAGPVPQKADKPIRVIVAKAGVNSAAPMIEAAGTAALRKEIPLGFTSSGRIARILVQEGDRVQRGQLLALLDTTNVAASLETAAAERDRAAADLQRMKVLFTQGWITKSRLETAEAAARTADATLKTRRFSVETARVIAPAAGVILARQAEPSQIIDAGTPIVSLGDSGSGFVLRALLSDRDVVRVRPGTLAEVTFEALPGALLQGRVLEVGGRSDRNSGTFTIEIGLQPEPRLRSGLVGKARIAAPADSAEVTLLVPPTAIFAVRAEEGFVYVLGADRRVKVRQVQLGKLDERGMEIVGGLKPDETLVLSGLDRLRDGMVVDPVQPRR